MDRGRDIEVLKLAQRISAELESGRVDDVDIDDETLSRVGAMLAPPTPTVVQQRRPAHAARPGYVPQQGVPGLRQLAAFAMATAAAWDTLGDAAVQLIS